MDTYLPPSAEWYNYNTHLLEARSGSVQDVLTDLQQAIWMRAGSIVPLLAHNNELSLLRALEHGIKLDVFLTSEQTAEGTVVLDDGWSTKPDKSSFRFSFDGALKYTATPDSVYAPETCIVQVNFYGLVSFPQVQCAACTFNYNQLTQRLTVDLDLPLTLAGGEILTLGSLVSTIVF